MIINNDPIFIQAIERGDEDFWRKQILKEESPAVFLARSLWSCAPSPESFKDVLLKEYRKLLRKDRRIVHAHLFSDKLHPSVFVMLLNEISSGPEAHEWMDNPWMLSAAFTHPSPLVSQKALELLEKKEPSEGWLMVFCWNAEKATILSPVFLKNFKNIFEKNFKSVDFILPALFHKHQKSGSSFFSLLSPKNQKEIIDFLVKKPLAVKNGTAITSEEDLLIRAKLVLGEDEYTEAFSAIKEYKAQSSFKRLTKELKSATSGKRMKM